MNEEVFEEWVKGNIDDLLNEFAEANNDAFQEFCLKEFDISEQARGDLDE